MALDVGIFGSAVICRLISAFSADLCALCVKLIGGNAEDAEGRRERRGKLGHHQISA